jgi:3',5'-cyclic AMP phosphodiesterase CpdA
MFPTRPSGWAALWQTDPANVDDGDWFINTSQGLGISGNYGGIVADGTWNRLALVVDNVAGTFTSFVNGTQVQQNSGLTLDGRWSAGPVALLFADENQENAGGFVNSVQLRAGALSATDIAALGGASAFGIPTPAAPTLRLISPNGGENFQAGSTQKVAWVSTNPSGLVQIDLYRSNAFYVTLAQISMRQSNYIWAIPARIGDNTNYLIKLTSLTFPALADSSDAPFSVFGSGPPPNPLFGQELQINGGFESFLDNWQTIAGHPATLAGGGPKGAPHSGARFFHGGLAPAGDAVVRQEIDLILAGFTAQDIDGGAALDAQAWLRNWFGAGTFDDQVFYRVAYLDRLGGELASTRCMVAANSVWLSRNLSGLLPVGTRKLRVEIVGKHRRDPDNDSMADDLLVRLQEALLPVTPQITKLPMLQDVRSDAMTLLWETDGNLAQHAVDWGRSSLTENTLLQIETLEIDSTHFVHRATLSGLETETRYVYRVRSGGTNSPTFGFRTAPRPETPFAVAWWGDNHAGTVTLQQHISNMKSHGPDMIMVAGDMVNSGNLLAEWHDYWFKPLEHLNLAQTTPVIFARGNHDGEHALAYAYSALPGNEAWFAFDYGNCRFIFLDTEVDTSGSPEQFTWLQTELSRPETQRAAFRIVCFHRPPYANLWNGGGYIGETFVRNDWVPLLEQKNVDLVISGHSHCYNRGFSNGVAYVVSGGGGGVLDVERVAQWPLYTVEYSKYHYDLMEVNGRTLSWETYDDSNSLIDMFTLNSSIPVLAWQVPNPSGALPLVLSGKPGTVYTLESSTDLANWGAFSTNTIPPAGQSVVANVPQNAPQRFFRARF